jgi:hypothetical protein
VTLLKVYRADKRRFNTGEPITTAREFSVLNPDGIQLEDLFTKAKPPGKPARIESLFLFENYDDAEWHWAKMRDGVLYECEIDAASILHRGDMRLIDLAGSELRAGADPLPHAHGYWAGESTDDPRWELLAVEATITTVICADQQLRVARISGHRLPPAFRNTHTEPK